MKKKIAAVLLAAVLCLSLSACGKVSDDKGSSADGYTADELKAKSDAVKVLSEWYDLMNEAKYSEAVKLMTPEYAASTGYDQLTDGEVIRTVAYEIIDDGIMLSMDTDGNLVAETEVDLVLSDDPENKHETFLFVTCYKTGALISGDAATYAEAPQ
ncbi:MAG: hypothetical protein IJ723_05640 [Ruminococcus sp.]|nr:hypothetical protein [Ruminococcus sp.]